MKRSPFLQCVLREMLRVVFLLPYLSILFQVLLLPHPAIHFLLLAASTMLGLVIVVNQVHYLIQIWMHGPSEPPVHFRWRNACEDLISFLLPIVLIGLLMVWSHYPW